MGTGDGRNVTTGIGTGSLKQLVQQRLKGVNKGYIILSLVLKGIFLFLHVVKRFVLVING